MDGSQLETQLGQHKINETNGDEARNAMSIRWKGFAQVSQFNAAD
jgi:hypothetical protein